MPQADERTRHDLVEGAALLAAALTPAAGTPVERNTFLSLVAGFMVDLDLLKLRRTLQLVAEGSGGHLKRGESYREQIELATKVLEEELPKLDFEPEELRYLFGWTAKLLLVSAGPQRRRKGKPRSEGGQRGRSPGKRVAPPPQAKEPAKLASVKSKDRGALEEMMRRLQEDEQNEKG